MPHVVKEEEKSKRHDEDVVLDSDRVTVQSYQRALCVPRQQQQVMQNVLRNRFSHLFSLKKWFLKMARFFSFIYSITLVRKWPSIIGNCQHKL